MSITAHLFVLFKSQPSADRLASIAEILSNRVGLPASDFTEGRERLRPVDDADLMADVRDNGDLNYRSNARTSKLLGAPQLDGRLYEIGYLTRYWSTSYSGGPAMTYAFTQLVLLAQADVEGVWLSNSYCEDGLTIPASTHETVHRMIDDFVSVGETTGHEPTRYIRTEDGLVINI
ncbi:hypothetical protein [Trinickia mobilis]|uniref:hypothetical protein n=1 Tax=Trinickia mobilis TaxID=2816356 RepID=UPI001A8F5C3D|nr:hypothetical protein [Trinickia mobilis]